MTSALVILHKVVVNYFYRVNAGLFSFAFFVLFGAAQSPAAFHYSLITGIMQSQTFLTLVMLCWLLYNFKCINYVVKQLQHQQQSFLFCINGLSKKKVYLYNFYVHLLVYMPVLLYAIAIVIIAVKKHAYVCAIEVILFNLFILLFTPFIYVVALQQRRFTIKLNIVPSINVKIRKPYFLFPLYFLLSHRKQMVLVTKIFSLLLLFGFIKLYEPDRYDIRPIQLCLLIIAASHCAIAYDLRSFEEEYLAFSKNLPLTIAGRFLRMTSMYFCLLLPEFIFLLKGLHQHFSINDYPQLLLLVIALLIMFHVALLLDNANMEQLIKIVFGIISGCFFIILYNPGIVLPVAILALAFVLFNSYYYYYEKQYR